MVTFMLTAKVFENGRSQAVRLPKECRFDCEEVSVTKIGDMVMLIPKDKKWATLEMSLDMFTDDFMKDGRAPQTENKREEL